jgi:hypothetical protein
MQIACPGCKKTLNVSESITRKHVRCPACKTVVALPDRQIGGAAVPRREIERSDADEASEPVAAVAAVPLTSAMRCPKCHAATVQRLPPNRFSRHPGYICATCSTTMRPPGSGGLYVFVIILGAAVVLFGLFAGVIGVAAEGAAGIRGRVLVGAVFMAGLGAVVAGWAVRQMILPVPLDAPARPSRLLLAVGILLLVSVLGLLAFGGCLFGIMYYIHEM